MAQTRAGAANQAAKTLGMSRVEYLAWIAQGLKWCSKGKHWTARTDFGKDVHRSDGLAASCLVHRRVAERKNMKGRPSPFKGRSHTPEARHRMSLARKGNNNRAGKKLTDEQKRRMSLAARQRARKGEQCWWTWKGGVTKANAAARGTSEYQDWRKSVFERDGYTCRACGDNRGGNLTAHHVKSFADHPELRLDINNGITLCVDCHGKEHDKPGSTRKIKAALKARRMLRERSRING